MLSAALIISGVCMLPSLGMSLLYAEYRVSTLMGIIALICIIAGITGRRFSTGIMTQIHPRLNYMTILFTWIMLIFISVFVFLIGIPEYSLADAVLESTASWTTTGIGIFDMADLPMGLQLWRATCNWLGGVGIIMVALSLMAPRKFVGWGLASVEFPGPSFIKSESPFRMNYRKVVGLYAIFTLIQFVLLCIADMEPFTALLTTLSNTSTAGLRHIQNGVVSDYSAAIKVIITVFSFLGSVNCLFFLYLYKNHLKAIKDSSELRFYLWRIIITTAFIAGFVKHSFPDMQLGKIACDVLMQVISFVSTSGYIISDCNAWPQICVLFILLQMFIGSCALSTGGGIKGCRIIIAVKSVSYSIYRHIHPCSVRTLTYDKKPMKSNQVVRANLYIALFMMTYLVGALLLTIEDIGVYDALNYSQAMITNTGTSIGELSAPGSAAGFTSLSKYVMSVLMLAGRLELYPLLMIFFRNFWKSSES